MKNKLSLQDLPQKTTYVLLKEKFKKRLFKDLENYLDKKETTNLLKVKKDTLRYWKRKGEYFTYKNKKKFSIAYIPLFAILKISKFLTKKGHKKYSMKNIEKDLIAYKRISGIPIFNPKFPIEFETKEGAIVIAALLHDGGIASNEVPTYSNSESCMRIKVVNAIKKLVGDIKINPTKRNLNFPKIIKDIVSGLDMQIGRKTYNNPIIPRLFLKTKKKEIVNTFLNQAFSDDGSAYISKYKTRNLALGLSVEVSHLNKKLRNRIKQERITNYAPNLLKDCKILLEKIGIKVNGPYFKGEYIYYKENKKRIIHIWEIGISRRKNIERFQKLVGFSIPRKNQKVKDILESYKEVEYGTSFKDAWQRVINLKKKGKNINANTLMKERNCSLRTARGLLKWLREENVIKKIGGGYKKGFHGYTAHEYNLVKRRLD